MIQFFSATLFVLFALSSARAENSCKGLFVDKEIVRAHAQIEQLNASDLLLDVILISRSPLLEAIQRNSFVKVWNIVENQRLNGVKSGYFDEINIATALGRNDIALYLYDQSAIDFRRIPLREDLLMTAIYFGNVEVLTALMLQKNLTLPRTTKVRALRWFDAHKTNRVRRAMLLNERIQNRQQ
jgi:hypothetical protein